MNFRILIKSLFTYVYLFSMNVRLLNRSLFTYIYAQHLRSLFMWFNPPFICLFSCILRPFIVFIPWMLGFLSFLFSYIVWTQKWLMFSIRNICHFSSLFYRSLFMYIILFSWFFFPVYIQVMNVLYTQYLRSLFVPWHTDIREKRPIQETMIHEKRPQILRIENIHPLCLHMIYAKIHTISAIFISLFCLSLFMYIGLFSWFFFPVYLQVMDVLYTQYLRSLFL